MISFLKDIIGNDFANGLAFDMHVCADACNFFSNAFPSTVSVTCCQGNNCNTQMAPTTLQALITTTSSLQATFK